MNGSAGRQSGCPSIRGSTSDLKRERSAGPIDSQYALRAIAGRYEIEDTLDVDLPRLRIKLVGAHAKFSIDERRIRNVRYLVNISDVSWHDRAHFFGVAAQLMRRILVDAARARASVKRAGQAQRENHSSAFDFDNLPDLSSTRDRELMDIDDALGMLAKMDPRKAQVIELRFFGGLSVDETAQALNVSPQTVMRDWKLARAWMMRELRKK